MKHNTNKSWGQVEDKMRRWGYFWLHWWNNKGDLPLSSRPPNGGNSTTKIRTSKRTTKQSSYFPAMEEQRRHEATAGIPPPSRSQKHYIHHPSRFFNFSFSEPSTTSTTSTAPTLSATTTTEATETPVFTPQNRVAVNYATHRKKTPKTPNMSLIWVLPRVTETSQKNFLPKIGCFLLY